GKRYCNGAPLLRRVECHADYGKLCNAAGPRCAESTRSDAAGKPSSRSRICRRGPCRELRQRTERNNRAVRLACRETVRARNAGSDGAVECWSARGGLACTPLSVVPRRAAKG